MPEYLEIIPCPLDKNFQQGDILSWQNASKQEFLISTLGESTENIISTTDLQTVFRQAALRRRRVTTRKDGPIHIYEDEDGSKVLQSRTDSAGTRQGAGLIEKENTARSGLVSTSLKALNIPGRGFPQAKSKNVGTENRGSRVQDGKGPLEKEVRRKSTCMSTRDLFDEIKRSEAISEMHYPVRTRTCAESFSRVTRGASSENQGLGRDSLTAAPKREVLQPPIKVLQEQCATTDRPGRKTGKENMPPGQRLSSVGKKGGKDGGGLKGSTRSSRLATAGCFSALGASNRTKSTRESDEACDRRRLVSSKVLDVVVSIQDPSVKVLSPRVSGRHSRYQKDQESCSRSKGVTASHIGKLFKPDYTIVIPKSMKYALL